jgi:hypothetical protein
MSFSQRMRIIYFPLGKRKSLGTRRLRKGELLFDMTNDRHNIPTSDDTFATPIKAAANRFEPRALE